MFLTQWELFQVASPWWRCSAVIQSRLTKERTMTRRVIKAVVLAVTVTVVMIALYYAVVNLLPHGTGIDTGHPPRKERPE